MATCSGCRRPITAGEAKNAVTVRDDAGKIKGMLHRKCHFVAVKRERMGPEGRYLENTPTPYEMNARRRTATDLTDEVQERRKAAHEALALAEENRHIIREKMAAGQTHDGDLSLAEMLDASDAEVKRAQESAHLTDHQADLEEERAKEDHTGQFNDWRDPTSAEI